MPDITPSANPDSQVEPASIPSVGASLPADSGPNGPAAVKALLGNDLERILEEANAGSKNQLDPAENTAALAAALNAAGYVQVDPDVYVTSRMVTGPIWFIRNETVSVVRPVTGGMCYSPIIIGSRAMVLDVLDCQPHEAVEAAAREQGLVGPGKAVTVAAASISKQASDLLAGNAGMTVDDAYLRAAAALGFTVVPADKFPLGKTLPSGGKVTSVGTSGTRYLLAVDTVDQGKRYTCTGAVVYSPDPEANSKPGPPFHVDTYTRITCVPGA